MPNLHDLATIIGNYSLLAIISALAAGLSALALMSGVARLKRNTLPDGFPSDPEWQLDKFAFPFQQLTLVGQGNEQELDALTDQLKNQPAAYLGLTAFQKYSSSKKNEAASKRFKRDKS
jgi:hypothetical protein